MKQKTASKFNASLS